jgi:hypothetical protein
MRQRDIGTARRFTRRQQPLKRLATPACLAALSLVASAPPAAGSVTIGQLPPSTPPAACSSERDTAQPTVTSGNPYVVPATGGITAWTVTSWSTFASADLGQSFTMKLFRQVAGMTYTVVGHDGPRDLIAGALNTFPSSVAAKPGDVLGLNSGPGTSNACNFTVPMDTALTRSGNLADGESGDFGTTTPFFRVNITAVVAPTNTFSFGDVTRNKKKGTATLTVDVPNPGELALSGRGVKAQRAGGGAVASKTVTAAGTVKLLIKAKGKKKRKLNKTGKVKVYPKVTYTPTGGDPSKQSKRLKLKKRLKKR